MVFPSVPLYLDPPSWNQQQLHHHNPGNSGNGGGEQHQLQPVNSTPPRPDGGMAGGSIRPGSMADRARLAKIPQPEPALKCPRCDSTNTKFCYFNNYSLSQPRHFCKTCRRYWTRGGALRSVPVGGGCRRNKRSKSTGGGSSSKSSSATAADRQGGTSSSSTATSVGGTSSSMLSTQPQLPFMTSLHTMIDYGAPNIGLGFTGMQPMDSSSVDYHQVGNSSSMGLEQWRLNQIQQFPFLGGLEHQLPPVSVQGLYPFDGQIGGGGNGVDGAYTTAAKASGSELISQMASVKMEDNQRGLNLARQYLGVPRNDQFWAAGSGGGTSGGGNSSTGGGWMTDLSGFNSSTTGSLL